MREVNFSVTADIVTKAALAAGMIGVAILAPNALLIFDKAIQKSVGKSQNDKLLKATLSYMKQRNYVKITELPSGEYEITITDNAVKRLEKRSFNNLQIKHPKRWDQKWRIVLFDIPEKHKAARNALTYKLKQLGFKQLQRSAWIHPYDCVAEIALIKSVYGVDNYVTVLTTDTIDNHNEMLKKFSHLFQNM